jgi:SulP family sulfate permease
MTAGIRRGLDGLGRVMLPSLHDYRRSWLTADLTAALTLLAIAVPEQLATSRLAGMPPLTGFYAFIAGGICFALFGPDRHISVGADSTIAPLFAAGVATLAATGSTRYVGLVGMLAVMVGIIVFVVGLLRLGWIAQLLSTPIITGFLTGVAVTIAVHQLPDLLGIASPAGSTMHRIGFIATHLSHVRGWSVGVGLAVLLVVVVVSRRDRRLPGALVALVASTAVVTVAHLRDHGVSVLGRIPKTPPRFWLVTPSWPAVSRLLPLAGVVALVIVSQSAATARSFAGEGFEAGEINRDFVAVGIGNVVSGLGGSFPVNASPPRTAAVVSSGGRSQLTSVIAVTIMVALVPAASLLQNVPLASLAAILLFVASRIVDVEQLLSIGRFSRLELGLSAIGALAVAFVGVEQGIAVAVGLAILDRTRRAARPQLHVLGRVPGTTSFAPLARGDGTVEVPGVLVVLFATPLWYANAQQFRSEMDSAMGRAAGRPRAVVLDTLGMSDIDFTGARALQAVLDHLDRHHVTFALARAGQTLQDGLARAGLIDRIGANRLFVTVGEAVDALTTDQP